MSRITLLALALLLTACGPASEPQPAAAPVVDVVPEREAPAKSKREREQVLPGVEVLLRDHVAELQGLRVGILTNPTGVTRTLESTIDAVLAVPGVEVVRLFGPEHGVRGQHFAGAKVNETVDAVSGLPVVSLYGATRRPTPAMLEGLDAVLYDIQDVGHRTYTYVSTLTYLMEACADAGVAVWVLDRPDPLGGRVVGGPMLDPDLVSFIGAHPVPQVYGMTPGEWAQMIRAERVPNIDLQVIPLDGWRRGMTYGETGLPWVPPSQHIPHWESSFFYAMTGTIGELRRVNEGVGTPTPFELIGAPWLDGREFAARLNALELPGVRFRALSYTPRYGTGSDELLQGVQIHVLDYDTVSPPQVGAALMAELAAIAPDQNIFARYLNDDGSATGFLKALGDRSIAEALSENRIPEALVTGESEALDAFRSRRADYLIYR
jgi:uncharacterized protein YbbC (DUF1343 family)